MAQGRVLKTPPAIRQTENQVDKTYGSSPFKQHKQPARLEQLANVYQAGGDVTGRVKHIGCHHQVETSKLKILRFGRTFDIQDTKIQELAFPK